MFLTPHSSLLSPHSWFFSHSSLLSPHSWFFSHSLTPAPSRPRFFVSLLPLTRSFLGALRRWRSRLQACLRTLRQLRRAQGWRSPLKTRRRPGLSANLGWSGLRPSLVRGDSPPQRPLEKPPENPPRCQYPIIAARRLLSTTKGVLSGPSWIKRRCSSWSFVALRG